MGSRSARLKRVVARKGLSFFTRLARRWNAVIPPSPHPAAFWAWAFNRSTKVSSGYQEGWLAIEPIAGPFPRVAVVLHVFYPELVSELLEGLEEMPVPFDLIVTNATGSALELDTSRLDAMREMRVYPVENRGRDILPLVHLVNAGILNPYEVIGKFHTKKSAWRAEHPELAGSGDDWRTSLLGDLLGADAITRALSHLGSDSSVGIVTSTASLLGPAFWGDNQPVSRELLLRLQLQLDESTLRFAAGSMYWARGFVLQGLRALDLSASDFDEELGQTNATTAHALERLIGVLTAEAGLRVIETGGSVDAEGWRRYLPDVAVSPRARAVPFYLPQYHPFEENDRWWGKGFTEWSNVAAAKPLFPGHWQPFLPGDLGFYDLRDPGVLRAQSALAREAGIEGFMYYYYWFAGTQLMSMPVEQNAAMGTDGTFCIMWANENWTRRWDGADDDVLIAQNHEDVPAKRFIDDVLHLLRNERYLTIGGAPVIAVYRVGQIPKFEKVVKQWRKAAAEAGIPRIKVLSVNVGEGMQGLMSDPTAHGLDGSLEFPPHRHHWALEPTELELDPRFDGTILSYRLMVEEAERRFEKPVPATNYPGVMVGFDNTSRRQWAPTTWYGANPYTFRRWLRATIDAVSDREFDERVVFINAWNEWAESAVLEPSQRFGHSMLLAVRDALYS